MSTILQGPERVARRAFVLAALVAGAPLKGMRAIPKPPGCPFPDVQGNSLVNKDLAVGKVALSEAPEQEWAQGTAFQPIQDTGRLQRAHEGHLKETACTDPRSPHTPSSRGPGPPR
jgi:hypothetical protein